MKKTILTMTLVWVSLNSFGQERTQHFTESKISASDVSVSQNRGNTSDGSGLVLTRESLILPTTSALTKQYLADISQLNFSSVDEAQQFFNMRTGNLVSYELDFSSRKVTIKLNTDYAKTWSISEWNTYLANQFQR
ncbi:MAG: hypothetical protein ACK5EK_07630 [Flavobacteriia bacterium]|jgi:uncharacterized lipoprotein YbaY